MNPLSCSVADATVRDEPTEQGTSDRSKGDLKEDTQNMNCPDPIASTDLTDNHQPVVEITDGLVLIKENGDDTSNSAVLIEDSGVVSLHQAVLLDLNSPAADHEQNETQTTATVTCLQEKDNSENNHVGSGDPNSISQEDLKKSADSSNGEAVHGLESANGMPEPVKQVETPATTTPLDDPSLVCFYRCCPQCVSILQDSMRKLVTRELRLGSSHIATEGIHDAVSSLSVELIAAVRKFISARATQEVEVEERDESSEKEACPCKSSPSNFLASAECCSHSAEEQGSLDKANASPSAKSWLEPVFVFRDGILVPLSSSEDDSALHCRYDSFCLGSLIELVATEMKPF